VSVSLSVYAPGVGIVDHRTVLLELDESPPQPRASTGQSFFAYLMALCVQRPPDHSCTRPCDGLPMMLASIDWCCDNPGWGQAGCTGCVCRVRLVWASWARDTLPGNTASDRVSKGLPQGPARSPSFGPSHDQATPPQTALAGPVTHLLPQVFWGPSQLASFRLAVVLEAVQLVSSSVIPP